MPDPVPDAYTYGDSAVAGDRLALLASIFDPTTAAFLRAAAVAPERRPAVDPVTGRRTGPPLALAIDLGCGPGFTTRLIAEVCAPQRVVGFDFSDAFIARAREETAAAVAAQVGIGRAPVVFAFVRHDVTRTPFPVPAAPLLFARYLTAHLTDPAAAIAAWTGQLTRIPAGRLLLEEIVSIETDHPVLGSYVETVTAMSAAHDTDLLIGRRLPALVPPGHRAVHDELVTISPDPRTVARMFGMNLTVWRDGSFARDQLANAFVDDLARSLAELAGAPAADALPPITWTHRQLAIEPGDPPQPGEPRAPTPPVPPPAGTRDADDPADAREGDTAAGA